MRRIVRIVLILILVVGAGGGWYVYDRALSDNVNPNLEGEYDLLIPPDADFDYVVRTLETDAVLQNTASFEQVASFRKYDAHVKPGRYLIKPGMNNWDLVGKLRSGDQDQMKLRFGTRRTLRDLAEEIGGQLAFGADTLHSLMKDNDFLGQYDESTETIRKLFVPNTYFVYWTISPEDLFARMKKYQDQFWNAERKQKARKLNMSTHEVVTLASIVQAETYMPDERARVAGLYLNRIRDGIPLQADPTVIFAVGDFSIKRVLKKHLEYDSPYNTYLNRGLPPGPINNPEASAIDGVLNHESHEYYYMCAKADFSGYHNFARTLTQHNRNAREYQRALNKKKVYK